ncbi:putative phospholipase D (PLD) [Aspergillus lucknowensis]|uniref:phospholipase D n=1 Tax=Aspergillus lucknowensis TaxID=176173 RepID=A0ABR4LJF5_9EURO
MSYNQDHLAYGQYHGDSERAGEGEGSARSLVGDTFNMLKSKYKTHQSPQPGNHPPGGHDQPPPQNYNPGGYGAQHGQDPGQSFPSYSIPGPNQGSSNQGKPPKQDKMSGLFGKFQGVVADLGGEVAQRLGTAIDPQGYAGYGAKPQSQHRFGSFAPDRQGNDVQWYVDGCSYFYAVSRALETARESIWILDWWLSPELYLRRPPAKNEQYRLDRLLHSAAQRGVKVNIIVYKEVTQALTLSSHHTKHHLEDLHQNIAVFRHPDHLPDRQGLTSSITSSLQNLSLDALRLGQMSVDAMKGVYGIHEGVILYWAHHEKLCIVDGAVAFMGGLDLCYGRWDTHHHAISDVHDNPSDVVFPGQDYNNARVLDFTDVAHPEQNKLDRTQTSRMGWSDVAVSLHGPAVGDLRHMFVERWNFIYDSKYQSRNDPRFSKLALYGHPHQSQHHQQGPHQQPQPGVQQHPGQQPHSPTAQLPAQSTQPSWNQQQTSSQPSQHQQSTYTSSQPPVNQSPQPSWNQQQAPHQPGHQQPTQQSYTAYIPPQPPVSQSPQPSYSQQQASYQQAQQQSSQPSYSPSTQPVNQAPQEIYSHQQSPTYQAGQHQAGLQSYSPSPHPVSQSPQPSWNQQQAAYQSGQHQTSQQSHPGTPQPAAPTTQQSYSHTTQSFPPPPSGPAPSQGTGQGQSPYFPPPPTQPTQDASYSSSRGAPNPYDDGPGDRERGPGQKPGHGSGSTSSFVPRRFRDNIDSLRGELAGQIHQYQDRFTSGALGRPQQRGNMSCQILRSCGKWSNGTSTEHSIADAYVEVIRNSEHFVYIENQFFITATGDQQKPVKNKIGAAIVERILRAARAGQKYKIVVVIPCVPCFAGDLADEAALGTRAIMEFQYNSINRGGNSIMELIAKEGYNPMEYIRFYNLRNYDRIKYTSPAAAPQYGGGGFGPDHRPAFDTSAVYQSHAPSPAPGPKSGTGQWNSVSACYMLNGPDLRNIPWDGPSEAEIDAFVTEELYVHSKVMIADDRVVICGSANINDRSQLGDHDSEIAVLIEDTTPVQSVMNGRQWTASRFAASLRRHLFRKHLGLLPPQDYEHVNDHFDFDSPESQVVADPLADTFLSLWNTRAHTNTEVFREVFHSVPDDTVRNWTTYKEFYGYYFKNADKQAFGEKIDGPPAQYKYGHVVSEKFPGPDGVKRVKELLSQVKGTLVEMPLMFLCEEDVAESGLTLNELTEPLYT